MYRKTYSRAKGNASSGAGKGDASGSNLPRLLKNREKYKRDRHATSTGGKCVKYGSRDKESRCEVDMRSSEVLSSMDTDKKKKEKGKKEEECRIPEKEAKPPPCLKVEGLSYLVLGSKGSESQPKCQGNAKRHRTAKYKCNQTKDCEPVLRRGQEFKIKIFLESPYDSEQDDLSFIVEADYNPGKNLRVEFKMGEDKQKTPTEWAGRLRRTDRDKKKISVSIYIPADCVVGKWELKVKTKKRGQEVSYVYEHDKCFFVIFNPWCKDDQVYYTGKETDLNEYVLNDKGTAYFGTSTFVRCKAWNYGQFDEKVFQISLSLLRQAFGGKVSPAMSDPVAVTRALSRIINSADDNGVLEGNWSGNYDGGISPTTWASSVDILLQYHDTEMPVKFGQCWVFSHVLTTVCRALGLPCRSVTNFDSAHDTDNSCTIDCYYDEEGEELGYMKSDSIWNFHVWNEVWMCRPEITNEKYNFNGWHVIDATPQEQSDGIYQCGPCPVNAVKEGCIYIPHDTAFVFAEVNADVIHWVCDGDDNFKVSACKKRSVGSKISTKPCNGGPHKGPMTFWKQDDPNLRQDLTDQYKYKEGSEEERLAVKRAVRQTGRGAEVYADADITVDFDKSKQTMVGQNLTITAMVKNQSSVEKNVKMLMSARTSSYWNEVDRTKPLCKLDPCEKTIKPGAEEKLQITVPADLYTSECDEELTVYAYARATDVQKDMPHTAQEPFKLAVPDLDVQIKQKSKSEEVMPVKVTFTNPLDKPLTNCWLTTQGDFYRTDTEDLNWKHIFWTASKKIEDVKPNETRTIEVQMYWKQAPKEEDDESDEDDEDDMDEHGAGAASPEPEEEFKTQSFQLKCKEFKAPLEGSCTTQCSCD